ncbi:MAG: tRNA (guanine(10)-N(2))-dimethyltransferase [Candidatus Micrarchaeota archaeon]|nr:tRNA (guanine(10)-N(2))-dimethyltransferase [Candidatus Micrarchaeota archaeon]
MQVSEGKVKAIIDEGVFYNPQMELCRTLCSLAVGALGKKVDVADVMCASGIRGIRYKKENKNAGELALCDRSKKAIACAEKNAKLNKIKCATICKDAREFLREAECDFLELDPFGTPVPFLHDSFVCLEKKRESFFSVTATDTAVLCGAHASACLKNYGAVPLNNHMCHENGLRILAAKVVLSAAPFNLAAVPVFSISHKHYMKIIFKIQKGAQKAVAACKSIGFGMFCPACLYQNAQTMPIGPSCPSCSNKASYCGPIWLGQLWDGVLVERMKKMAQEIEYAKPAEKLLCVMQQECKLGAYGYYDIHWIAKKLKADIAPKEKIIDRICRQGFSAVPTHFCPTAIRTDAPHDVVIGAAVEGARWKTR